jgi:hypothetical protein
MIGKREHRRFNFSMERIDEGFRGLRKTAARKPLTQDLVVE